MKIPDLGWSRAQSDSRGALGHELYHRAHPAFCRHLIILSLVVGSLEGLRCQLPGRAAPSGQDQLSREGAAISHQQPSITPSSRGVGVGAAGAPESRSEPGADSLHSNGPQRGLFLSSVSPRVLISELRANETVTPMSQQPHGREE